MENKNNTLDKKRKELLHQIKNLDPWIEGSVVCTARICGKKGCACRHGGPKHPVMYLTTKEKGKTVSLYVPRKWEEQVRVWAANYKQVKKLVRQVSDIQRQIIKLRDDQ